MTTLRLAMFAIFLALPAHAAPITTQSFAFDGAPRSYSLYVPDNLGSAPAPLLVLLHGSGQTGAIMAQLWQASADQNGIMLLAPDALDIRHWNLRTDGPSYIAAAVAAGTVGRAIDPRRIYLFGQSGGAVYALTLAMLESRYFAAVAVHAGAWRQPEEFKVVTYAQRKTPVAIIIGDRDEFFPLGAVRETGRVLERDGFPAEIDVVEGQHHWYDEKTAPGIDATAWTFLKAHSLDQDPVFVRYGP
jgi:polyhydroxybutyrate depolymerase